MSLIKTKADYLKLKGFEVEIDTNNKSYVGEVTDLSDDCNYIILLKKYKTKIANWIQSLRKRKVYSKIPLDEITLVEVLDRKEKGKLKMNTVV